MKKIILSLSIITLLYSCSKDAPANQIVQQSASGAIQFKVNGNLMIMDNIDLLSAQYAICYKQLKGSVLPDTRYMIEGQKGANNALLFAVTTDSLKETSYHYDSTFNPAFVNFILYYNGQESALLFSSDVFDINISSYKNGHITGTFTGKLTPFSGSTFGERGTTIITEGVINNVSVIY